MSELESELGEAKQTVARLKGEHSEALPSESRSWILNAPERMNLSRELPYEVTDEGFEAIAELLRKRVTPNARLAQVGRVLTYQVQGLALRVERLEGKTRVTASRDYRSSKALVVAGGMGTSLLALAPIAALLEANGLLDCPG